MIGLLPVVRIEAGKYLVGTNIKTMSVKNDIVLVRTGGGLMSLEEHISRVALAQCKRLKLQMMKFGHSY